MISDNKKGNPYHDEDGKFTSGSGVGGSANPKSQKNEQFEFDVVTLDNDFLGTVQAGSEIEAFELASQKYPGYGDELDVLKVETKDKLEEMGFGPNEENENDSWLKEIDRDIQEQEFSRKQDIDKLTQAGFSVDTNYSGGNTYSFSNSQGKRSSIHLGSKPEGYYIATINGQDFAYRNLDDAIDRTTYKSGKSPYEGSMSWNGRTWEDAQ